MQTFGIYERPLPHAEDALMAGETDVVQWPLDLMRRQQLHSLARAYELPLAGDTKQEILPGMKAAQKSGLFNQLPKHPKFARKAMQHSDQPRDDLGKGSSFSA